MVWFFRFTIFSSAEKGAVEKTALCGQTEKCNALEDMKMKSKVCWITNNYLALIAMTVAVLATGTSAIQAATINVPNGSFELQSGAGQPFGVNINVDSWQKAARPDYFPEAGFNGFFWVQTAGVFVDTNPYGNRVGAQAGYLLPFPGAGISQDLSSPDAKFEVGMSYDLTLGIFGKNMTEGSFLHLSLFYRDGLNNMVTVGTPTTITYSAANFPITPSLNLIDYSAGVATVQVGDAWAGKNIGIKIESVFGDGNGNWDMDNARLTAVPEPASLGLLTFGLGGLLLARSRRRR